MNQRAATAVVVAVLTMGSASACDMFSTAGNAPPDSVVEPMSTPTDSATSPDPSPEATATPDNGNDANNANHTMNTNTTTPPPVFNCNTTLFPVCDGFETVPAGQPPDANRWTLQVGPPPDDAVTPSAHPADNFIRVTTAKAHRGKASLQVHGASDAEHIVMQDVASALRPSTFLPAPNNTFFVRMWFYFDGFSQPPLGAHMYIINASGPLNGRQQYQKFGGNERGGVMDYSWVYFGPDAAVIADTSWTAGAWACYEVEFKGDTSELYVWINGVLNNQLTSAAGVWPAPDFNRLTLGWEVDHPPSGWPGVDIYLDDVAYSYQRIGCDN